MKKDPPSFPILDFQQIDRELEAEAPRRHYWTPEEDLILKKYYLTRDRRLIAEKLNRSLAAVVNRADKLGLTRRLK